jgi:hypothetical protein
VDGPTTRYAIKDGVALSVEEFCNLAETFSMTGNEIAALSTNTFEEHVSEWFYEGPPCLQHLAALGGFPDGTRNNGIYNTIVYLKKRFKDDWQSKVHKYNEFMCHPSLAYQEIETLIRSASRKEYEYKCKEAPINSYCNRSECQGREFGVGGVSSGERGINISSITKVVGDPVIWYVGVGAERIKLTTDHLMSQQLFAKEVVEKLNFYPQRVPDARWARMINEKIQLADIIEVPEDATEKGQFFLLLQQFLTTQNRARSLSEVLRNVVYLDKETSKFIFRSVAIVNYFKLQGRKMQSGEIFDELRQFGIEHGQKWVDGQNVRVWWVDEKIVQTTKEIGKAPNYGSTEDV